jgi:hypothetical protein
VRVSRTAELLVMLAYLALLLLCVHRPAWWNRLVERAKRFAQGGGTWSL